MPACFCVFAQWQAGQVERDPRCPGKLALLGRERPQEGLQAGRRALQLELVALDPRHVDHVVDERTEPVHGVPDPLQVLAAGRRVEAQVEEALRMTADQGEGGSQLVRDRGDEARLEGIEGARLAQVP